MGLARAIPTYLGLSAPVNGDNLVKALKSTKGKAQVFLAVPIFLDLLFEHPEGLQVLKTMVDQVHVAGGAVSSKTAALTKQHDKKMQYVVASTEAGVLLYSGPAKIFTKILDWEVMSVYPLLQPHVEMEVHDEEDGGSEVVIKKGSPILNVSNRLNGDFATGDLFLPGPKGDDGQSTWKFWRKQDEVIVLGIGMKSDPITSTLSEEEAIDEGSS